MDISAAASFVTKGYATVPVASQQHGPQKIEEKAATSDAGSEARDHPEQDAQAQASRDIIALRKAVVNGERPAGPPPSFEVSLLEVEADLQNTIARMETDRSQYKTHDLQAATSDPASGALAEADPDQPDPTAEANARTAASATAQDLSDARPQDQPPEPRDTAEATAAPAASDT